MIDTDEAIAGTDPRNAESCLTFSAVETDGAGFVLRWRSASNRTYGLHRGTRLIDGFSETLDETIPATPPVNVYTDQVPPQAGAFYRITVTGQ
jgi:hypothetical protein